LQASQEKKKGKLKNEKERKREKKKEKRDILKSLSRRVYNKCSLRRKKIEERNVI